MKRLLLALLVIPFAALAQAPILRNSLDTNTLGTNLVWFPATLQLRLSGAAPSIGLYNISGGSALKSFDITDAFGQLRFGWNADNFGSALVLGYFDTQGSFTVVATNAAAVVSTPDMRVGGGVFTNFARFPWTTLTMSGSNVSSIDFAAGSYFRLVATNNAFLTAPSNLPGTNVAQVIQFAFIQDGTGTRTLTVTNGSWLLSGSGTSTNQVVPVNTNANATTYLTFVTSPDSATKVHGVPAAIGQ
jgi:hypothetical protein